MMSYTDRHFRQLLRLISPHALLYTEMVVSSALVKGDARHLLTHSEDAPCALQLGGSDPVELQAAAQMGQEAGYQEINLNVGCPSDRVQSGRIGACLMAEPALVADCYSAMAEGVSIPVTIKSRIGIDDQDDYASFRRFISSLYHVGCRIFIVHARKAILSGLSPRENREIPPLKYDYVRRIKQEFPDCTVILNGGLNDVDAVKQALPSVDGVMLGRAVCADPWLLAELEFALFANQVPDRLSILSSYREYIAQQMDKGENFKHMARHLLVFFTGCPGARSYRRHLSSHMFSEDAGIALISEAIAVAGLDRLAPAQVALEQTGT